MTSTVVYARLNSDGTVGSWFMGTTLPHDEGLMGSVISNGFLYTLGGVDSSGNTTATVFYTSQVKWAVAAGTESISLNNATYTRSFYLTDVYRSTSTGDIVSSGGYYDPSTIKVNIAVNWTDVRGQTDTFTQVEYLSRFFNQTYGQTDWSGGSVGEQVTSAATTTFATSTGIDNTITPGSIQLQSP